MSTSSQYLVDNAMIMSTKLKYKGPMLNGDVQTLPEEVTSQFGNMQLSLICNATPNLFDITVFATNDDGSGPTWVEVANFTPTTQSSVFSLNIAYRRVYVTLDNGGGSLNVTFITLFGSAPLPLADSVPSFKTIDDSISNTDLFALGRNILMGRGRIADSAVANVTLAADQSLRVTKASKMYSFDDTDKLVRLKRYADNLALVSQFATVGSTLDYPNNGSQVRVASTAGATAYATDFVDVNVDQTAILVARGAAVFTSGSTGNSITRMMHGNVGVGTNGPAFGLWYNNGGIVPIVQATVNTSNNAATTVNITLNGIVYPCVLSTAGDPDYSIGTAKKIVDAFSGLTTPWQAVQVANNIVFMGKTFGVAGTVAIASTDPTFNAGISSIIAGAAGTWTHVPSSSFNLDGMATWASGDYLQYELSMFNNGRSIKLSVVDKVTQDLVDVYTRTFSSLLTTSVSNNMVAYANDNGSSLLVYNAALYAYKGSLPTAPPTTSTFNIINIHAYSGDSPFPVVQVSKLGSANKTNAILRKIIVAAEQPTRVSVNGSLRSQIGGVFRWAAEQDDTVINILANTYDSTFDPLNYGYTSANYVINDNVSNVREIDVNMVVSVDKPLIISACTNGFAETDMSMVLIFDYYGQ